MRLRCAAFGLVLLAGSACGQTTPEATEIAKVRTYLDQLPRITCTEKTLQTVKVAGATSTETREDNCDTRQYKLFAVQALGLTGGGVSLRHAASDWRERLREASLDGATGFLAAIVDPEKGSGLSWVRLGKVNGRAVSVFSFLAPAALGYELADTTGTVRVPYTGVLYADAETGAFVRIAIKCIDIPRESEYVGADVVVDFTAFDVAGQRIDLPSHSAVRFRMKTGAASNDADYRGYRLASFSTDSGIRFGDEVVEEKK